MMPPRSMLVPSASRHIMPTFSARTWLIFVFLTIVLFLARFVPSSGGASLGGNALALKSAGRASGDSWILERNGFIGTYLTLAQPGQVTLAVTADGTDAPRMGIAIGDTTTEFTVAAGVKTYVTSCNLPAGTHFLRIELNNDRGIDGRQLRINRLSVVGANCSNTNSNANALAASDTFIANYRRGHATVKIPGLSAGEQVAVSLKRIAFDFGGGVNIRDDGVDSQLSGDGTIRQRNYQQRLRQNFNTIVTAGPGYWCDNEPVQGKPIVAGIRGVYQYAAAHHMHARQHNLIWEGNQPEWINALKNQAIRSNSAKAKLSAAIDSRIGYYLASSDTKYDQIDVYNESYNDGELGGPETYLHLFGMRGIAKIHHDAKQAALQAGYAPALFVNDYGALQGVSNQYSQHIEALRQAGLDAGYGEVVDGIGLQYYTKEAITPRRGDRGPADDERARIAAGAHRVWHLPQSECRDVGDDVEPGDAADIWEPGIYGIRRLGLDQGGRRFVSICTRRGTVHGRHRRLEHHGHHSCRKGVARHARHSRLGRRSKQRLDDAVDDHRGGGRHGRLSGLLRRVRAQRGRSVVRSEAHQGRDAI